MKHLKAIAKRLTRSTKMQSTRLASRCGRIFRGIEQLESRTLFSVALAHAAAPIAPSNLKASMFGPAAVQLKWTDNDRTATGYLVLRNVDGKAFTQLAKLTRADASTFTDTSVPDGHTYQYEIKTAKADATSGPSSIASISPALAAPSRLAATSTGSGSIHLNWTDNDAAATGYIVLRSTDAHTFSQIANITGSALNSYNDTGLLSGHTYDYMVRAITSAAYSARSAMVFATTSMNAPTGLTASITGNNVALNWTARDSSATGYVVLRSTDGVNFSPAATISAIGTTSPGWTDTHATAGQRYYYRVRATDSVAASVASNTVSAMVPVPDNGGGGGGSGGNTNSVSISTRYSNELVITATGGSDSITIDQTGSTLSITADGTISTRSIPAGGVFVYTHGGADALTINASVNVRTTIETIDGANTVINSSGANVSAWIDATDTFTGSGAVHLVNSFAGNVSKSLGASLADPSDIGSITRPALSLWGTGPQASDINQGSVGDCYFLSTLAAFAGTRPGALTESAVDLGDGTYAVQFIKNNQPTFVRVSDDFSAGYFNGFKFAHPGANNTVWGVVMEKAFAYFRTGANTFASISAGWMGEVYSDLGVGSTFFAPASSNDDAFFNAMSGDLAGGKPVTLATSNSSNLVRGHAYTLVSATRDANGVAHYVVRNPWGVSGDASEDVNGYATLTFAQVVADFSEGCAAV